MPAAEPDAVKSKPGLTPKMRLLLLVFVLTFAVMIFGVSRLDWWFPEVTTLFFAATLVVGIIDRPGEKFSLRRSSPGHRIFLALD